MVGKTNIRPVVVIASIAGICMSLYKLLISPKKIKEEPLIEGIGRTDAEVADLQDLIRRQDAQLQKYADFCENQQGQLAHQQPPSQEQEQHSPIHPNQPLQPKQQIDPHQDHPEVDMGVPEPAAVASRMNSGMSKFPMKPFEDPNNSNPNSSDPQPDAHATMSKTSSSTRSGNRANVNMDEHLNFQREIHSQFHGSHVPLMDRPEGLMTRDTGVGEQLDHQMKAVEDDYKQFYGRQRSATGPGMGHQIDPQYKQQEHQYSGPPAAQYGSIRQSGAGDNIFPSKPFAD